MKTLLPISGPEDRQLRAKGGEELLLTMLKDRFQLEAVVVVTIMLETIRLVEAIMVVETMFCLNIALAKV